MLILDEATSALDEATEAAVLEAIARTSTDTTLVIVAHRASSLAICNRLLSVEGGTVVERDPATVRFG